VVDLLNTLEIMVLSLHNKPIEGLNDHLEDENKPEDDQEIDEIVEE